MGSTVRRRNGFTIIEILVVIGIIAVLAGLILPALGGAARRATKGEEINRIRQVGVAWSLYSNFNRDGALPGFLEDGNGTPQGNVQGPFGWNVRYKLPAVVSVEDNAEFVLPDEAEEWPWRLLPYLDFDHESVLGHMHKTDVSAQRMSDYTIDTADPDEPVARPIEISRQPSFGYNAFYVGGWWEMRQSDPGVLIPRPRFARALSIPANAADPQERIQVVSGSPSSIRNSTRLIIFCSSSIIEPGEYHRTIDERPGAHYVVPPIYAETLMWGRSSITPSETVIQIYSNTPVPVAPPIGRYTEQAAVLHADLHTSPQTPGALVDQRFWIDAADRRDFKHTATN